jgi:hypothetical protein
MNTVYDLSSDDLKKQINDDYAVILNSERANLPKALLIAEKLNALRARVRRGEWKAKFHAHGLSISYETASVYLRIWENWADICDLAAAKSVDPTLLTIDGARELWARRKGDAAETDADATDDDAADEDDGKPTVEAMEKKQAANAEAEAAALNERLNRDVDMAADRRQRVDQKFEDLVRTYPQDELLDLTERLAKHLGMTLVLEDTWDALKDAVKPTPPTVGVEYN